MDRRMARRRGRTLRALAVSLACGLLPVSARAQTGTVTGIVVEATSGLPLDGVLVTLEAAPRGLLPSSNGMLAGMRTVYTGPDGAYRFADVVPGVYRLLLQRLGFRPLSVEADVRRPTNARISLGLELEPVALEAVNVEERARPPFRRATGAPRDDTEDAARLAAERLRQDLFLTTDSRALTFADIVDGITLGENDVFRALQRFPGVATRDDYTAELWTRGAPWAQTRVTFDGLPLFNPVHAVGVFSGVTPDILGAVFFHPGLRSVAQGEGAAGVVDLRSRPGDGDGTLDGALDLSMATAKLTLDQRAGDAAWIVSARRSYLDVLTGGLDWLGVKDVDLPYAFHDLAGRVDLPIGERAMLEASALWEEDRLFGDVEDVLEGTAARWGNAAGRITLQMPAGNWNARHTIGFSRYRSHIEPFDTIEVDRAPPWTEPATDGRIEHLRIASEYESGRTAGPAQWSAGVELVRQRATYDGPEPRYHPVKPDTIVRLTGEGTIVNAGAWVEARVHLGERIVVSPGWRVEVGSDVLDGPGVRVAPRIVARYAVGTNHSISLGAGRSWQYLQALALAGPSAHPAFHAGQFWLWAGPDAPALRSDVVTLGMERWLGDWLASITAYARHATGVALPDPTPGALYTRRPLYVQGENEARGIEASVRRVAGPWSASFGYTYGESEVEAAGRTYPASTDRRHRVDAMAALRLPAGFRAGAAYTGMSGAPFTRVVYRTADQGPEPCEFGFDCDRFRAFLEEPNAERTPAYRSLDATLQWAGVVRGVEVGAYLQVRNVLDRDNGSTYTGSEEVLVRNQSHWVDRFVRGLPRMPLLGARIAF